MLNFTRIIPIFLLTLLGGCASTPALLTSPESTSPESISSDARPPLPVAPDKKIPENTPARLPAVPAALPPARISEQQVHGLILKLLPANLKDRQGWASDVQSAFKSLQISPVADNFCAVFAVIEQESGFQADPVVPGLPAIIRREIQKRSEKYHIPQSIINLMLKANLRDGRSFEQRINALRTEKQLSDLIEEIISMLPQAGKLFPDYNPVHTGGPMQVSVEFAESHVRARPYPYTIHGNLRNEVFSRRGGVYFGSAILLDYPAPYASMLYRFADFNAGRYSSRNAAFQQALSRVSGIKLSLDGDLLRYRNGMFSTEPSETEQALLTLQSKLQLNKTDIQRDLRLEKLSSFSNTPLYRRVFALAEQNGIQPRILMPQIDLKSPKISRKLTTEWFANRVNNRYKNCLQQAGSLDASIKPVSR